MVNIMRRRYVASGALIMLLVREISSAPAAPPSTKIVGQQQQLGHSSDSSLPLSWRRILDQSAEDTSASYKLYDESGVNEKCSEYLLEFLEGTTDARDTCEGIKNAYKGASCESISYADYTEDQDDYFGEFYEHKCCQSLLTLHAEYCEEDSLLSNVHLLCFATALLLCEVAKSLVKRHGVNFLTEAAVCILVGVLLGLFSHIIPGIDLNDVSFDEELFLAVLLPPIIFEAALTVSKKDFRRRRLAIFMFAVFGTIFSTFVTGFMVHYGSKFLPSTTTLPLLDSMIFGGLISSIDPVAILSVLTSLNLDQTDTVFILVFGESLLNDGVAITMSHVMISRFGEGRLQFDEILGAFSDFVIVGCGSIAIGFLCSLLSLVYFWMFRRLLNPGMEVGSFFLWALIPYWVCDGLGWSGIVAIVTAGFFMDIYIASTRQDSTVDVLGNLPDNHTVASDPNIPTAETYIRQAANRLSSPSSAPSRIYNIMSEDSESYHTMHAEGKTPCHPRTLRTLNIRDLLYKNKKVRLSQVADKHVRFVAHLMAALAENSIFVYLGLFLFSQNYNWELGLVTISVFSCVTARAVMVVLCCFLIWHINVWRGRIPTCGYSQASGISRTALCLSDRGTQLVLVFAGLRGAVSLALVESVPIYNTYTGEGCEYKPVLKAMTSASIIFTMFVFGGSAYYVFPYLGIAPDHDDRSESAASYNPEHPAKNNNISNETEMAPYQPFEEPPKIPLRQTPPLV